MLIVDQKASVNSEIEIVKVDYNKLDDVAENSSNHVTDNNSENEDNYCNDNNLIEKSENFYVEEKEQIENYKNNLSDEDTLKRKKKEIQDKLKLLPNNSETSDLTEKAIKSYLKDYKKQPKEKLSFSCDICKKILCSSTSLKTHILTHTNEAKWPHLCSICGKGFKTKLTYQEHLVTHDPSDPFKCNQCEKVYKNERKLKDHKLRAHSKVNSHYKIVILFYFILCYIFQHFFQVKQFLCGVCGKGLTQKDSLMKHMMIHTGI